MKVLKVGIIILFVIILLLGSYFYYLLNIPDNSYQAKESINSFREAIYFFYDKYNRFPTENEGLPILIEFLDIKKLPKDPWGNPYKYIRHGPLNSEFAIYSFGPDGIDGNEDDIASWQLEERGSIDASE